MSAVSNLTVTEAPHWDTPENHGPLVSYLTWFLVISSFLSVLTRVLIRYAAIRQVRWDDVLIIFAMLLAIGHCVTTSLQASHGLGRHIDTVSSRDWMSFQKANYASGFLYILVLSSVKISICLFVDTLALMREHQIAVLILGAFICLWMTSSIFVTAFRCQLPQTWRFIGGKCINTAGFWTYFHIINIVTDIALVVLPWVLLSELLVEMRRKMMIIACFAARLVVIAVTIVQIYYLQTQAAGSQDPTFDLWTVVLLGEVVLALSLITACIPYLKPFLEALETGMIRADGGAVASTPRFPYRWPFTSGYTKHSDSSKQSSKPSRTQGGGISMNNLEDSREKHVEDGNLGRPTAAVLAKGRGADSDNDSQTSQSKIIRKTVGGSVTDEPQIAIPPHTHLEYPSGSQYDGAFQSQQIQHGIAM